MRIEALGPMTSARLAVIAINATLRVAASALFHRHIGLVVCATRAAKLKVS